jgi:hypothetical protein
LVFPFALFIQLDKELHWGKLDGKNVRLGIHKYGYQPDLEDWEAYVRILRTFFNLPCSQAALLYGGIVWHLAIQYIDVEVANTGPSFLQGDNGYDWTCISGFEACEGYLVDDYLTENDPDIICGVYKVLGSKFLFQLLTLLY